MADLAPAADRLVGSVRALGRPVFVERSVKLRGGGACEDRVLLGIARRFGDVGLRAACLGLLQELGLGVEPRAVLDAHFTDASMVHLAREGGEWPVLKAYLEFPAPPSRAPCLAFLAYKWPEAGGPARAAFYRRLAVFDGDALTAALAESDLDETVRPLFEELFAMALRRVDDLPLLSVEEEGVPRRSLDLNLYDAGLTLDEVEDVLAPALAAHGAGPRLPAADGRERLGHVSAGCGADGRHFLTVYFGARLLQAGTGDEH